MIKFKGSVVVPKTVIILAAAANAASQVGIEEVFVTSGNDSLHMKGSKHYSDEALDLRTKGIDRTKVTQWKDAVKLRLGADYDVIWESANGPAEHLHIEHDPK